MKALNVQEAFSVPASQRNPFAGINWGKFLTELAPVLTIIALPFIVFWALWAASPDDRIIFKGDVLVGAFPTRVYVHRLLTSGEIPLWNPYQLGGMPLLADAQVAVYYLPNLILDFLYWGRDIPYESFEALIVAHYAIGALLMYGFLRHLQLQPTAALIGAIAFEFNGFFIGHRGHYGMLSVVVWVPGVMWFLGRAWQAKNRWRGLIWSLGAGLLLSQLFMGGHPQLTFYSSLFIFFYFLYHWVPNREALREWWHQDWRGRWQHSIVQRVLNFGVAGLIALGIAMVSLLPMFELLSLSLRNESTYAFSVQYPLMPRNFISLLIPEFLDWSGTEFRIYAGIFTLVLAVVAWLVPERTHRERHFFMIAFVVAVVMAMGGFTAVQGLLYRYIPGFDSVRATARLFYFANIALAVLAAMGLDAMLRSQSKQERRRLSQLLRGSRGLFALLGLVAAAMYVLLTWYVRPVGDEFYFYDSLFTKPPGDDRFLTLTYQMNGFVLFLTFLGASLLWLWLRLHERLSMTALAVSAVLIMSIDITTFATNHDAVYAPDLDRVALDGFEIVNLEAWQAQERDSIIELLTALPETARIDNADEALPVNYGQVWPAAFSTGYNVLDLQSRFEIQTEWPYLSDSLLRDLMGVHLIVTDVEKPEPPEEGAGLILGNSQGNVWQRATIPEYAHFSTQVRPAAGLRTINGLLRHTESVPFMQPTIASNEGVVTDLIADIWPEILDNKHYQIGETGAYSPVDISILAGGAEEYSAVIVDGEAVTPQSRGLIVAMIAPDSGEIMAATAFDTYLSTRESDNFANMILSAPEGTIVAVATYDEGTKQLTERARAALESIGGTEPLRDNFGHAYGVIGVKGAELGTAVERISPDSVTIDVGLGAAPATEPNFRSQVIQYEQDRISMLVENSETGLLTISETMFPGWKAYVDGEPTPILLTHGFLRSIVLEASPNGQPQEVTFVYTPTTVYAGMTISLTVLLLSALLFCLAWYFSRTPRGRLYLTDSLHP